MINLRKNKPTGWQSLIDIQSGRAPWPILFAALVLVVVQISWKPFIMSDEVTYAQAALHAPWWEANLGQYLFSLIASVSGLAGDYFYEVFKFINLIVWASSGFAVLGIAQRFLSRNLSLLIAGLHLFLPASFYASSFMPEALLAASVLWAVYVAMLHVESETWLRYFGLLSVLLFFATMTKAHGSVTVMGIAILGTVLFMSGRNLRWLQVTIAALIALSVRAVIGFLAGESSPWIFGAYNNNVGPQNAGSRGALAGKTFLTELPEAVFLHAGLVLLAIPLVVAALLWGFVFRNPNAFFITGLFGGLVLLAIYYRASTSARGEILDGQALSRYFEYLLPLAVIVGLFFAQSVQRRWMVAASITLLSISGLALIAISGLPYQTVANSALGSILSRIDWAVGFLTVLLSILVIVYWSLKPSELSTGLLVAPLLLISSIFVIDGAREFNTDFYWDKAGKELRTLIGIVGISDVLIVTENRFVGYAAGFYANLPEVSVEPNDWCLEEGTCSPDYILYLENLGPQVPMTRIIENESYRIFQP